MPRVTFDRDWRLGAVVFRPAGVLANEVLADDGQTKLHRSWAWAYKEAADTVARWDSATVEAEADNWATAEALIAEAMAVLRSGRGHVLAIDRSAKAITQLTKMASGLIAKGDSPPLMQPLEVGDRRPRSRAPRIHFEAVEWLTESGP